MIAISGNTYPVKDQLKALGGRWDPAAKCWNVPDDKVEEAKKIVASAGPKQPYSGPKSERPYRPRKCRVCGVEQTRDSRGYPNVRIYASGECQDCYEERKHGY